MKQLCMQYVLLYQPESCRGARNCNGAHPKHGSDRGFCRIYMECVSRADQKGLFCVTMWFKQWPERGCLIWNVSRARAGAGSSVMMRFAEYGFFE